MLGVMRTERSYAIELLIKTARKMLKKTVHVFSVSQAAIGQFDHFNPYVK
jgi:hypothetical protein